MQIWLVMGDEKYEAMQATEEVCEACDGMYMW